MAHMFVIGEDRDESRDTRQEALQKSRLEMMEVWTRAPMVEVAGSAQMLPPFILL